MTGAVSVLVVDDEPVVRKMLVLALAEAGCHVVGQAADGVEGVALARTLQPDAILLDIRMPNLDGLGAGRQIRTHDPEVRLAFFSAYDDPALRQEAIAIGAIAFLIKGCPLRDVVDALQGPVSTGSCAGRGLKEAGTQLIGQITGRALR